MAFPFAGFGTFQFRREEGPLIDSDSDWVGSISASRTRPLGSSTDNIVVMAVGSEERQLEFLFSPDRLDMLRALVGTTATFVDWDRPVPRQRSVFLAAVEPQAQLAVVCEDGETKRRIRTRITLLSQEQSWGLP